MIELLSFLFSDAVLEIVGVIFLIVFAYEVYKFIRDDRRARKKLEEEITQRHIEYEVEKRLDEELKKRGIDKKSAPK